MPAGMKAGSSTSTSTVRKAGPGPMISNRAPHHFADPLVADVVHEEGSDPALGLPGELGLGGPVAPQSDLHIPPRVDVSGLDDVTHHGAVRFGRSEDLSARIGVSVEVQQSDRPVNLRAGPHVRSGDRVVTADDHGQRPGAQDLADRLQDRGVGSLGLRGNDRRITEVDDSQSGECVDSRLEVRPRRAARGTDRPRSEARPRPIGDELVHRRADDRDVDPGQLGRVERHRYASERQRPRVVGLLAVLAPALQRVEHRNRECIRRSARRSSRTRVATSDCFSRDSSAESWNPRSSTRSDADPVAGGGPDPTIGGTKWPSSHRPPRALC